MVPLEGLEVRAPLSGQTDAIQEIRKLPEVIVAYDVLSCSTVKCQRWNLQIINRMMIRRTTLEELRREEALVICLRYLLPLSPTTLVIINLVVNLSGILRLMVSPVVHTHAGE